MRIGYLTYGLDRTPTGIGRYTVELARSLKALSGNFEIVLLTTEKEDHHGLWKDFEHYPLVGCRLLPALLTVGNSALARAARKLKLDIIHDPNGIAPFLSPALKAAKLVTLHDTFSFVYPEAHNRLDNLRYRCYLPYALKNTQQILTVSEQSRRDIQGFLKVPSDKIKVVAEGVDPCFRPIADSIERRSILQKYGVNPPYLLYVGSINPRKNIARLFEAFGVLVRDFPELSLVIGGKRQWRSAEVENAFHRLEFASKVRFTGYLNEHDLPALYSAAEAFVFPSLYEGFGLPPLEAMACGTPVITSNISSLPEVVGQAALQVNPYDTAELSSAISQVLCSKELSNSLIEKGLRRAKQFNWEHTALETYSIYEKAADLYRPENRFTLTLPFSFYSSKSNRIKESEKYLIESKRNL